MQLKRLSQFKPWGHHYLATVAFASLAASIAFSAVFFAFNFTFSIGPFSFLATSGFLVRASASSLGSKERNPASKVDPPATTASLRETCLSSDTLMCADSNIPTCSEMAVQQGERRREQHYYIMNSNSSNPQNLPAHKALKHDLHFHIMNPYCTEIFNTCKPS